jgi:hypothetical protein
MRPYTALIVAAVATAAAGQTLSFSNQTAAAGINVKYVPGAINNPNYLAPCVCGDFDGDGWQDLFLPSGGGTNGADKLYINQGDGTFQDQAAAWGLGTPLPGLGTGAGDYDGDGFLDLDESVAALSQNHLFHNNGNGSFTNVASAAGVPGAANDSYSIAFGDYDLDGDLDLFQGGFSTHASRLYRNNGNGSFSNVTTAAQLSTGLNAVFCFASHFVDMDGDHYPELLISGDFHTSRYFHNEGNGTFTNATASSGTSLDENGMGGTVGDFNRDGRIDWYVTSIDSAITPNWTGNKLYLNNGGNSYTEVAAAAGVQHGSYGWGTVGVDFNHDRWLDIAETNGSQETSEYIGIRSFLWLNDGDGTYTESSLATGFNDLDQGRGMLAFDYDNDGDEDLVVAGNKEFAKLWRNDLSGPNTHWLKVRLDTSADHALAPDGCGSLVRVTANGVQQTAVMYVGDNLQSQSELLVHFGLGAETVASEVRVEWNDGRVTTLSNVPVDQTLTIASVPVWTNLAGGLAGVGGTPSLTGSGSLLPGSSGALSLAGAAPSAACTLFVSVASFPAPFKGGVLVPVPILLLVPLATLPNGTLLLPFTWPTGLPSGTSLWFQEAIQDAAAVKGVSLSNALKATTP